MYLFQTLNDTKARVLSAVTKKILNSVVLAPLVERMDQLIHDKKPKLNVRSSRNNARFCLRDDLRRISENNLE